MKNIDVKIETYKEFIDFLRKENLSQNYYNNKYKFYISDSCTEKKDIISLYVSLENGNNDLYKSISLFVKEVINDEFDYKKIFEYIYYKNLSGNEKLIGNRVRNINFTFEINCNLSSEKEKDLSSRIIDNYIKIHNYSTIAKNVDAIIRFKLDKPKDYNFVENTIMKIQKNSILNCTEFEFGIKLFESKETFEFSMQNLHEVTLLYCKIKKYCKHFTIKIETSETEKYKIKAYMASMVDEKLSLYCNNNILNVDIESAGKIPPAIFIERVEDLLFFQNPLDKKIWNLVSGNYNNHSLQINSSTFIDIATLKNDLAYKYWPYLRMCQKFLFESFDGNESKEYTNIRKYVFGNDKFYDTYIRKIPFLAVCIFALYDNFYRDNLLQNFKDEAKIIRLEETDLLLSKQHEQKWDRYKKYQSIKDRYDVKNLLINKEEFLMHNTVEAEIFEAITLAEGLLQILENALLHAGGGLLSMRVYNRSIGSKSHRYKKIDHVNYLNSIYGKEYFDYIKSNFFLEVQISDLSNMSISKKFIQNHIDDEQISELLSSNASLIDLNYFFNPTMQQYEIKKRFYKFTIDNLVHHYGLEIFNSILTARKGILAVVGYNDGYDNLEDIYSHMYEPLKEYLRKDDITIKKIFDIMGNVDCESLNNEREKRINLVRDKIQNAKTRMGTSYRILLPLNHQLVLNNSPANNEIIFKENIKYITSDSPRVIDIKTLLCDDKKEKYQGEICIVKNKQEKINKIAKIVKDNYWDCESGTCLCINMFDENDEFNDFFESIIKGVLLFSLRKKVDSEILPIAFVNLSAFQLIEATRIIATYYTKNATVDKDNYFKNVPIYLKSIEIGKEIIFDGEDVADVENIIIKTAMKNGMMFNELLTIIDILKKIEKNNKVEQKNE